MHLCAITEMTCVASVSVAPDREVGPIKRCSAGGCSSHRLCSLQNYGAVGTTVQLGSLKIPFFFFPQVDKQVWEEIAHAFLEAGTILMLFFLDAFLCLKSPLSPIVHTILPAES